MTKSCSRRIVVLRDIPSNIIEEAILVLKNESNVVVEKDALEKDKIEKKRDFLIIKEAETIINSFVNDNNKLSHKTSSIKNLSRRWYIDLLINTSLIVGISVFIYLICKAF